MKKYLIYPNPDFTPVTTHTPDGILVAYDAVSAIWASLDGLFFKKDRLGNWTQRTVSQLQRQKRYGSRTATGNNSGDSYPHIDNFRVHKIMARAWIGPIPKGWEGDHINGDTRHWTIANIRILPPWLNHRDAGNLTILTNRGFAPRSIPQPTLLDMFAKMNALRDVGIDLSNKDVDYFLHLFNDFIIADPHARMDYEE